MRRGLRLLSALFLIALASGYLTQHLSRFPYGEVEVSTGQVTVKAGEMKLLKLPKLEERDRVMVELLTNATVKLKGIQDGVVMELKPVIIEGFKYRLVDYLIKTQRGLLIAREGTENYLVLEAPLPLTSYHVIFPTEWEGEGTIEIEDIKVQGEDALNVTITHKEGKGPISALLVYMTDFIADEDFGISLRYSASPQEGGGIAINLMSETDNYLYSKEIPEKPPYHGHLSRYEVDSTSQDFWGVGSLYGDKITSFSMRLTVESDIGSASFIIGRAEIRGGGKDFTVEPDSEETYVIPYRIYVTRKYSPDLYSATSWLMIFAGFLYIWRLGEEAPKELMGDIIDFVKRAKGSRSPRNHGDE